MSYVWDTVAYLTMVGNVSASFAISALRNFNRGGR